jgi:hypothetical protein
MTSSADGSYAFWIDRADYAPSQKFKLVATKTGYSSSTFDNISIVSGDDIDIGPVRPEWFGGGITATAAQNTVAIEAAIASSPSPNIIFQEGTYEFAGPIYEGTKSVTLSGTGWEKTILKDTSTSIYGIQFRGPEWVIKDLTIDSNGGTAPAFIAMGQYGYIHNLWVKNYAGDASGAVVINGATGTGIDGLLINDSGVGLEMGPLPTGYVSATRVHLGHTDKGAPLILNQVAAGKISAYIEEGSANSVIEGCSGLDLALNAEFDNNAGALVDAGYIRITNSNGIRITGRIKHQLGTASKNFFTLTGTNYGISFYDIYYKGYKTGMTFIENTGTVYGLSVSNILTDSSETMTGIKNTASVINETISGWTDITSLASHTLDSTNLTIKNVYNGAITITPRATTGSSYTPAVKTLSGYRQDFGAIAGTACVIDPSNNWTVKVEDGSGNMQTKKIAICQ